MQEAFGSQMPVGKQGTTATGFGPIQAVAPKLQIS